MGRMKLDLWTVTLIVMISLSRIGMGIYNALSGPTLLYLSANVDVSVTVISTVFTARSIGNLVGAVLGGVIKRMAGPNFKHLMALGISVGLMGLMDLVVPWIRDLWLLICDVIVGGIMYGYLDAGLQALLLQLCGEEASRPYIQLFHFMYSVGAFITPLIASPFLLKASQTQSDDQCPNSEVDIRFTTISPNYTDGTKETPFEFNPIGWTYIIAGVWLVFVSLTMVLLSLSNLEKKVSSSVEVSGMSSETREEEPIKDVALLFLIIIAYYFFCVTTGNVFYNFIYSIAFCSDLKFTSAQASGINSVFWLGLGLGRFSGIVASSYFKPRAIILFCISGCIVDSVVMCIWGESTAWIAWTVSGVHGYTTSLLYPSGVSWLSQFTNISGTYMFVFNIGNALGSLTMLPLAGYIFDINPFSVMYLVLGLAIGTGIVFLIALRIGKHHMDFVETKTLKSVDEKSGVPHQLYPNEAFKNDEKHCSKL